MLPDIFHLWPLTSKSFNFNLEDLTSTRYKFVVDSGMEEVYLENMLKERDYKGKKEVNQQLGTWWRVSVLALCLSETTAKHASGIFPSFGYARVKLGHYSPSISMSK